MAVLSPVDDYYYLDLWMDWDNSSGLNRVADGAFYSFVLFPWTGCTISFPGATLVGTLAGLPDTQRTL